jgi:ACS family tartrate transporter-like MFS transporter
LASLLTLRVLALCLAYFGADLGLYGIVFWIPQIFAQAGIAPARVGYVVAIPYTVAAFGMVWWSRHSDRHRERTWHIAIAAVVGFLGLATSAYVHASALLAVAAFTVGVTGTLSMLPIFWTLPAALLRGAAAAAGIALINAIGNIGGFAGPYAVGWIRQATGSFTWGLIFVAAGLLLTGIAVALLGHDTKAEYAEIPAPGVPVHNAAPEHR